MTKKYILGGGLVIILILAGVCFYMMGKKADVTSENLSKEETQTVESAGANTTELGATQTTVQTPGTTTTKDAAVKNTNEYFFGADWKVFNAGSGQFQAKFPTYPTRSEGQVPGPNGMSAIEYVQYDSTDKDGYQYSLMVTTYPEGVDLSNTKAVLEGSVNGSVAAVNGELMSSSFTSYSAYPSVDYVVKMNGTFIKIRTILAGRTMYILQVFSTTNNFPGFITFASSVKLN